MCEERWTTKVYRRKGLKVLQSHGTQDMVLHYPLGVQLKNWFEANSLQLHFESFPGDHTIPPQVSFFTGIVNGILTELARDNTLVKFHNSARKLDQLNHAIISQGTDKIWGHVRKRCLSLVCWKARSVVSMSARLEISHNDRFRTELVRR